MYGDPYFALPFEGDRVLQLELPILLYVQFERFCLQGKAKDHAAGSRRSLCAKGGGSCAKARSQKAFRIAARRRTTSGRQRLVPVGLEGSSPSRRRVGQILLYYPVEWGAD